MTITASGAARFGAHCHTRPVRQQCTNAKGGRVITPHPHDDLLAAARALAAGDRTPDHP